MARVCALGLSFDELLPEALRETAALCGAERAVLAVFPEGRRAGDAPEIVAFPADDPAAAVLSTPPRRWEGVLPPLGRGELLLLRDGSVLPPDDPWRLLLAGTAERSALLHPLRIGAALSGALLLLSGGAGRFGEEQLPSLSMAASVLAAALDRRSMERRLAASEERYRFLAENSRDFITLHEGGGGECLYASPVSGRLLGVTPEAYRKAGRYAFVDREDLEAVRGAERDLAAAGKGSVTVPHRLRRSDGTVVEAETVLSLLPGEKGSPPRVLGVTRDVTARREMERTLAEGRRLESLGHLAGGVAHEFNNLLAGIQGSAEILAARLPEGEDGREGRRQAETISRLVLRAGAVTGQLLACAGRDVFAFAPVEVNRSVRELLPLLSGSLPGGAVVAAELAPSLPEIRGDAARFRRLVTSLCVNAAEALPPGGTVTVRTRLAPGGEAEGERRRPCRRHGALPAGDRVVLSVEDGGCGMDGETLERIFDPFFSTKFAGRGLGLAAACGIAERHGASIEVESAPGAGTTVVVSFPAGAGAESPAAVPGDAEAARAGESPGEGSLPRRVLLAEDDGDVRSVLAGLLDSLGYEAVEARDGLEALEIFSGDPDGFGAVLLDQVMPRMTGSRAFAAIRRIRPGQKGILSSGYDEGGRPENYAEEGFSAFLHKPYRREDLARILGEILGAPA
jgi:PAS domain S-box-containing protein